MGSIPTSRTIFNLGIAKPGMAFALGAKDRGFKSLYLDQLSEGDYEAQDDCECELR